MILNKITILGHEVDIIFDDNICHLDECVGICRSDLNKIILSRTRKSGEKLSKSAIEETLLHEVIHFIFDKMGITMYTEQTIDEKFISTFGNIMYQVYKSIERSNGKKQCMYCESDIKEGEAIVLCKECIK